MNSRKMHPIGIVSLRTGLSTHVIRVWEKRYSAVTPGRSGGNQRLYSDDDIARLLLLKKGIAAGRGIGNIAELPDDEIRLLIREDSHPFSERTAEPGGRAAADPDEGRRLIGDAIDSVRELDARRFRAALDNSGRTFGMNEFIDRFLPLFLRETGARWHDGSLRIFHEHFATGVIRTYLGDLLDRERTEGSGRLVIAVTPPRQLHELGALLCAVAAVTEGFEADYLGPNTPIIEIARAAELRKASMIALSIIYPKDDGLLIRDLEDLAELTPTETAIVAGGGGTEWYRSRIHSPRIEFLDDLASFRNRLALLHRPV